MTPMLRAISSPSRPFLFFFRLLHLLRSHPVSFSSISFFSVFIVIIIIIIIISFSTCLSLARFVLHSFRHFQSLRSILPPFLTTNFPTCLPCPGSLGRRRS